MDNNVNLEEMVKNMDDTEFMFFALVAGAILNPDIKKSIDDEAYKCGKNLD